MVEVRIQYFKFNEEPSAIQRIQVSNYKELREIRHNGSHVHDAAVIQVSMNEDRIIIQKTCDANRAGTTAYNMIIHEAISAGLHCIL